LRISWAPAKNRIKERTAVATVSALPCPQGCPASAGREITTDTTRDIRAISTSTEESIPSPRTARLPEWIPAPIFKAARQRFPARAVTAAVLIIPALRAVTVDSDKRRITPFLFYGAPPGLKPAVSRRLISVALNKYTTK
jgi:hypothetical protein